MLCGFEPYSCWVSLYYETCANGNILSLGHLWLDIKCQLIAHSRWGIFFHHCKTTTKNTMSLMGVANIQLLVVSQSTAGLYINLHQKVGHCQPTVTQGQPAVSLSGLHSALGEKSEKRSASKASQTAVWGEEKAEESFHLPSPPLSCFTSFFLFLFPPLRSLVPGDQGMLNTITGIELYLLQCIMFNLKGSSIFWSIIFRFFFCRFQRNHSLMKKRHFFAKQIH